MGFPFGAAIGAAADLAGAGLSFLGGSNAQAIQSGQQQYANQLAYEQQQFERQAAQQGIRWRVYDAKMAGISPLVALGAPTFNPGAISAGVAPVDNAFAGAGHGLTAMGQDISRAAMAAQSDQVRADTMMKVEQIKNNSALTQSEVELNNANAALARRRAELVGTPAMNPPGIRFGVDGQPQSGEVTRMKPSDTISPSSSSSAIEAAVTPGVKAVPNMRGGYDPQPSLGTSVGATGEGLRHFFMNRLSPPAGYHMSWDGAWYPDKGSSWWDRPFGYSPNTKGSSSWYSPDYSGVSGMLPY